MKPGELLESELFRKSFGPGHRITKQVSALRKRDPELYPAGTKATFIKNKVTAIQAANLILILTTNPNPFNASEFDQAVNSIKVLKPFLNDLAIIFASGGIAFQGKAVKNVQISLQRPFGQIVFHDNTSAKYGIADNRPTVERFAVIGSNTLQELSHLINNTPRTGSKQEREEFLNHLENEKIN